MACIPKYTAQDLSSWLLCIWSIWAAFVRIQPLSWLPTWLKCVVVDSCFIHCYESAQKLIWITLKYHPNCSLNHRHIAVLVLLGNMAPISHKAFSYVTVHAKYSSHILSISLQCQVSSSLSPCGYPKQYGGFFWSWCLNLMFRTWGIIGVCTATFKFTEPSKNGGLLLE